MTSTRALRATVVSLRAALEALRSAGDTLRLWAPDGLRGEALHAWADEKAREAGAETVVIYRWSDRPVPNLDDVAGHA